MFGDCIDEILKLDNATQLTVLPEDTVMMAMCKSLYAIATEDIYHKADPSGCYRDVHPSDTKKRDRDAAMRIILERSGGRKTLIAPEPEAKEYVDAPWIAELPGETT